MAKFWTCEKCGTNIGTDYNQCPMCSIPKSHFNSDDNLNGYVKLLEAVVNQLRFDILLYKKRNKQQNLKNEKKNLLSGKYNPLLHIYADIWNFDFSKVLNGFISLCD